MDANKEFMNAVCQEGKEITVSLKIVDKVLAEKLLGTMYDHDVEYFGVKVNTWGFYNIEAAYEKREKLISAEMNRHTKRMSELNNPNTLRQMLEEK